MKKKRQPFHSNVLSFKAVPNMRAVIDLLTPGMVAQKHLVFGDDTVDVKLSSLGSLLILTARDDRIEQSEGLSISWVIATKEELLDESYKKHFRTRLTTALERLKKELAGDASKTVPDSGSSGGTR